MSKIKAGLGVVVMLAVVFFSAPCALAVFPDAFPATVTRDASTLGGHEVLDDGYSVVATVSNPPLSLQGRTVVLAHSGVDACFDGAGGEIACPASGLPFHGQDGSHRGVAAPALFYDQGDGTVLDVNTGLTWQQGEGGTNKTWEEAIAYCSALDLGGVTDWRLPSRFELLSIIDLGNADDNALSPVFQGSRAPYWTVTESAESSEVFAWHVNHGNGGAAGIGTKNDAFHVRCVLGSPVQGDLSDIGDGVLHDSSTGLTWQRDSGGIRDWEGALAYCAALTLGGQSDWRLPSLRELHSIVEDTRQGPALNPLFSAPLIPTPARAEYWSGTSDVAGASRAWTVDWYYGATKRQGKSESENLIVRCVRGFGDMSERYHLELAVVGPGSITSNPRGVDCPGVCSLRFLPRNASVDVTTHADANAVFVHWSSGDTVVSVDGTLAFAVTSDRSFTARFETLADNFFIVSAASSHPSTGGTVSGSGYAIVQGGADATITATAKPGWIFVNWTENGTEISTSPQLSIQGVTGHRYLTANFRRMQPLHPFPDTGQTRCYDAESAISCPQPGQPFYGQDVQYQPRQPRSYTKLEQDGKELPNTATQDDGWIMTRDNVTGLIWQIKTRVTMEQTYSRSNAEQQFIAGLNRDEFGGFDDWRLPGVKELASLVDHGVPVDQNRPGVTEVWFPHTMFLERELADYWAEEDYREDPTNFGLGVALSGAEGNGYAGRTRHISKSPMNPAFVYAVRNLQPAQASLIDHGDGTVTDPATGLIWQKETSPTRRTWQEALGYAENLSLAGFADWRLPSINELQSLADYERWRPAVSPVLAGDTFQDHPYWSSTSVAGDDGGYAKTVLFDYGFAGSKPKTDQLYVRSVRTGASIPAGSLKVDIEPDVARVAGMQWRSRPERVVSTFEAPGEVRGLEPAEPTGQPEWHDSGADVRVAAGTHRITFSDFTDWDKPGDIVVTVGDGETVERSGTYTRTWDVTVSFNEGGEVRPPGPVEKVDHGEILTLSVVPDDGNMATVAADEGACGGELADDVFTTLPIVRDCEVNVEFSPIPPIPTLSQWGMLGLAAAMLVFGSALLRGRRSVLPDSQVTG